MSLFNLETFSSVFSPLTFPMVGLGHNFAIKSINRFALKLQGIKTAEGRDSVQLELHGVPGDVRGALASSLALRLPQHGQEGGHGPVLG